MSSAKHSSNKKEPELEILILEMKRNQGKPNSGVIKKAYFFAKNAHKGQKRKSGAPFFTHPYAVALTLAKLGMDSNTVAAALLHDAIEEAGIDEHELRKEFGSQVYRLVEGVTKLGIRATGGIEKNELAFFQKVLLATTKDMRVITIKLADKLHNMQTIKYLPPKAQKRASTHTLEIFAPLAYKLGIYEISAELEALALENLKPKLYIQLEKKLAGKRLQKTKEVDAVIKKLKKAFSKAGKKIEFRKMNKKISTVYNKMQRAGKSMNEIEDSVILKVIAVSIDGCYSALGIIHNAFQPIPNKLKDYVAIPRFGIYRSIHTAVIGPNGKPIKIYIRTPKMDRIAEYGIIACLAMKGRECNGLAEKKIEWLNRTMKFQSTLENTEDYLGALTTDALKNTIFVFTPDGKTKELPVHSTVLDFAYSLNDRLGNKSNFAIVNHRKMPVWHELEDGDMIEVVPSRKNNVERKWLGYATSYRAKNGIINALGMGKKDSKAQAYCLKIKAVDRIGLMAEILSHLPSLGLDITECRSKSDISKKEFNIMVKVRAYDSRSINRAMQQIKCVEGVISVKPLA